MGTNKNINCIELYKTLFENSTSIMLIIDPKSGEILDANTSACNFYGYNQNELTHKIIQDINILPEGQVFAEMKKIGQKTHDCFNFKHKLANGELRYVEMYCNPITCSGRKVLYSVIHDVTERKALELQIEDGKKISESLINSLPGIMYLFNASGHIKLWNKNVEIISGYQAEQIKAMNILDFITEGDKERLTTSFKETYHGKKIIIETNISTKSGQRIPYLFSGYTMEQNNEKYIIGIGIDISDRLKAEIEKERAIKKLNKALSQVKQLSGFLPICASCKKIRDDKGYWNQIEIYIKEHSNADFSHSICPECAKKLYPDFKEKKEKYDHR